MATRREKRLQKAEKLVQRGRLEAAIEELHMVLKEAPDDTRTLNRVGDLYARLNRVDEAADLFSKAAERFSKEGFFVKAIAIYKKILRLDPTRIPIYERLAELYQHQGLANEARGQYQILADYYEQQGDSAAVISVYERLVQQDPQDSALGERLGELLAEAGRNEEAIETYREVATALLDSDQPEEAVRVFEQALEAAPEDLKFVMNAVMQLQSAQRPELLERFLTKAEELNPEAATARTLLEQATVADAGVGQPAPIEPPAVSEPEPLPGAAEPSPDVAAASHEPQPEVAQASPESEPEPEARPEVVEVSAEPEPEPTGEFEIELEAFESAEETAVAEPAGLDEAALDSLLEEASLETAEAAADRARETEAAEEAAALATLEEAPAAPETPAETPDEVPAEQAAATTTEAPTPAAVEPPTPAAVEPPTPAPAESPAAAATEAPPPAAVEPPAPTVDELLAEADALAGYGLETKAAGRLANVLEMAPGHLGAYRRLINIEAQARRDTEVVRLAAEAAQAALAAGATGPWQEIVADLERHGYRVEGASLIPPAPLATEELGDLLVDAPESAEAAESEAAPESTTAAAVESPETPAADGDVDSDDADLESVAAGAEPDAQFFDLGAELEMELGDGEAEDGGGEPLGAQTVEEIVHGFKQGMAEVLSPEAFETHYNLGVAYREMGLIDEAIGEFQLAAKDPRYLVECCSLLGQCFAEKDFADLALKWYRRGLESPHVSEEATLGLLYEVGNLHLASGDRDAARDAFAEIYGVNSNFRDVVAKLEELRTDRGT